MKMSEGFAFNLIIADVQESIKCQDSRADAENLATALRIMEAHLEEYFTQKGDKQWVESNRIFRRKS